jgi:hypothetical protein
MAVPPNLKDLPQIKTDYSTCILSKCKPAAGNWLHPNLSEMPTTAPRISKVPDIQLPVMDLPSVPLAKQKTEKNFNWRTKLTTSGRISKYLVRKLEFSNAHCMIFAIQQ